ncbi:MAG: hypothetical protein ICV85_09000 [Tolypothrix sp. T3-bin4]|nr:hypothetical protein [Tolypothrix sp. T3-bin4]
MKKILYKSLIVFLEILASFSFVSTAWAGRGRQPLLPRAIPEPMPTRLSTRLAQENPSASSNNKPLSLGNPYRLDNIICRETEGNIICLNPEEAKKLRWSIPTNN